EITLKLIPKPRGLATLLALLPDLPTAGRAVGAALSRGLLPRCMELLDERTRLWAARRELSRALRKVAANKLAEDVVVPRSRIPDLIDRCQAISERSGIPMPAYGHAG